MAFLRDKRFLVGVGAAAAILLVAGGILWFTQSRTSAELTGKIYLTIAPEGTDEPRLYAYYFRTDELRLIGGNVPELTSALSPDGTTNAFMAFPRNSSGATTSSYIQVKTRPVTGGLRTVITKSRTLAKRFPDWSPDGSRIAFMALPGISTLSPAKPNTWGVYVTDLKGREHFVMRGAYPKWSADGTHLAVLKDDGLYIAAISADGALRTPPRKVWDGSADLEANRLNMSADRTGIALTDAASVRILRVDFTEGRVELGDSVEIAVRDAVFSPDGRSLALLRADAAGVPRLSVYSLAERRERTAALLAGYVGATIFLTQWR